jgi:GTP-binding protein
VVDLDGANGFVIADIPGLIEGASEGIGLGHEFLRHIERTKVLLHIVDAASVEGRDPVEDIKSINQELEKYDANILKKPMIIAANKLDVCPDREEEILSDLRKAFPDANIKIFGISAVSGKGVKELLYALSEELKNFTDEPTVYDAELDTEMLNPESQDITIEVDKDGTYVVEGEKIAKMLGYTNLESEKGFLFFQNFLKTQGILEKLENMGIEEGDIVSIYGLTFEYFK